MSRMRQLLVLRHGESDHNVHRYFSSDPKHPRYRPSFLTDHGRVTIEQLKPQLPRVDRMYASPLPRTMETAKLVHQCVIPDYRLIEGRGGSVEGQSFDDVPDEWNLVPYGGESPQDLDERLADFIEDPIIWGPSTFLGIVTHAAPAEALMRVLGVDAERLPPAGARWLKEDIAGQWSIQAEFRPE